MAQYKVSKNDQFEVLIIGAGLSGLISAQLARQRKLKFGIIAPESEWGGSFKALPTQWGQISRAMDYMPKRQEADELLHELEARLLHGIKFRKWDEPITTFDSGEFKTFVGFGDQPPQALDAVSSFLRSSEFYRTEGNLGSWITEMTQSLTDDERVSDHVTRIEQDEESGAFFVEVNGARYLSAQQLIYCDHPLKLIQWAGTSLAPRVAQKLAKPGFWTNLSLTLVHPLVISEDRGVHLLMGAKKEPTLGLFDEPAILGNSEQPVQVSRWYGFIPNDLTEDTELIGQTLREMKKQMTRAYPEMLNNLLYEKLVVTPAAAGVVGESIDQALELKGFEGLWLAGGMFSSYEGLLGELSQPMRAFKQFEKVWLQEGAESVVPTTEPQVLNI